MTFADHFSSQANAYAAFRPSYPDALGAYLASVAPGRAQVWDCATGSGQAATMLARHFDQVVATDASAAQLRHAEPHDGVRYELATAEASGLPTHSCDAIVVAQAVHWFNLPAFYAEVRRVLKPGGVLAVWCYLLMESGDAEVDAALRYLQYERLGTYWPAGRELVDDHYHSLPFPFPTLDTPAFEMTARWTHTDVMGYLSTWSAVARCRQLEGQDPLIPFATQLQHVWPTSRETLSIRWPLYLKAGKVGP